MEPVDDNRDKRPDRERIQRIEDLGKLRMPKGELFGVREGLVIAEGLLSEVKRHVDAAAHGEVKEVAPLVDEALAVLQRLGKKLASDPARTLRAAELSREMSRKAAELSRLVKLYYANRKET